MFLGYNTNGLAHHDLFEAVELLAEIGYRGVAITIDHGALAPGDLQTARQIARLRDLLEKRGMRSVIETGARFLLDPREKHEPTLVSESPRRRIDFYRHAIDCAAQLGSDCVSIWSGTAGTGPFFGEKSHFANKTSAENMALSPWAASTALTPGPSPIKCERGAKDDSAMSRHVAGLRETLDYAEKKNVVIAFEPEPGMFIDAMPAFDEMASRIDSPNLRLTLDIGHLHCQGESIAETIRRYATRLTNVHIEDMRRGVHEHLMFGEGEIDFPPVLQALCDIGYAGGVYVELSRHSREGPTAARKAFEFLFEMIRDEGWEIRDER